MELHQVSPGLEKELRWSRFMQRGALVLAGVIATVVTLATLDGIKQARDETATPAFYSEWRPMFKVAHPGDWLRFQHRNETVKPNTILMLVDGFKNIDTGDQYDGVSCARITATTKGVDDQISVRQLPVEFPPGRYILMGFAESVGKIRTNASWFQSAPFRVVSQSSDRQLISELGRKLAALKRDQLKVSHRIEQRVSRPVVLHIATAPPPVFRPSARNAFAPPAIPSFILTPTKPFRQTVKAAPSKVAPLRAPEFPSGVSGGFWVE